MIEVLKREFIYIWYYFEIRLSQIFWYWVIGMTIGSFISVFAKDSIHMLFAKMNGRKLGLFGIIPACLPGIAGPLCMYGAIPIAASFSRQGMLYGERFRYCMETFRPDHITWGEDYPYRRKDDIRRFLENSDLSEEDKEKIAHGNAERLWHIQ